MNEATMTARNNADLFDADITRLCQSMPNKRDFASWFDEQSQRDRHLLTLQALHGQVCNGGFAQWVENGYRDEGIGTLYLALGRLREQAQNPDTIREIEQLVQRAEAAVETHGFEERGHWLTDDAHDALEPIDDAFFKISDAFKAELEAYFAAWH